MAVLRKVPHRHFVFSIFRKNWARLIQNEVDPLICPKCKGTIIIFIEDQDLIRSILEHLGLWLVKSRPYPKAHSPLTPRYAADNWYHTAVPDNTFYGDPDYSWDAYIQS